MAGELTTILWRAAQSAIGRLPFPYRMNFAVTKECHSKCRHCSIWKEGRSPEELSLEEIRKVAEGFPHLSWLSLTGGEPTDRPDLPQVVEAFRQSSRGLYLLNFSTNGLNRRRVVSQVREILKLGIPKVIVAVSIDGPKESHDRIRGISGGFELAAATLNELLDISDRRLKTFASMTLFPENVLEAANLFPRLKNLVPKLKADRIHFNLGNDSGHLYRTQESFSVAPGAALAGLRAGNSPGYGFQGMLQKSFQSMIPEFLLEKKIPVPCAALQASIHLDERGNLFPCTVWNRPLGNVRDHGYSISALLKGTEATSAKEAIKKHNCPQCWSPCEAYQSIAASPVRSFAKAYLPHPS